MFGTEVRAIIKLVFTYSGRFPVENIFPLIKNDVFSKDLNIMSPKPTLFLKRIWREPLFSCWQPPDLNYSSKDWSSLDKCIISWIPTTLSRIWDSLNSHFCLGSQFMICINKKLIFSAIWIWPSGQKIVASIFERLFGAKLNL